MFPWYIEIPPPRGLPLRPKFACAMLLLPLLALVTSCGRAPERDGPPPHPFDASAVPDAVPQPEPRSKYGNASSYVVFGRRYYTLATSRGYVERGVASWYGRKFHGRRTSSGEPYDMYAMTAAHRSLPIPTYVAVTHLSNGRRIIVRVNDRGPFHANRIIDLSYAAAKKLGIVRTGTGLVEVRAIDPSASPAVSGGGPAPERVADPTRLFLQVGAFTVHDNAQRMKTRLHSVSDRNVHIIQVLSGAQPIYRVRLGPLEDVEQADRLAERLSAFGVSEARIVVE